jgi:hypothetical protein
MKARQDVAGPAGGEAGVAARVDIPRAIGMGQHAAGAFDDHAGVEPRGKRLRGAQPIRLYRRRRRSQEARGFGGMRCGDRRRIALRDQRRERGVAGDRVQRIRVEHQRNALGRGLFDPCAAALVVPNPGPQTIASAPAARTASTLRSMSSGWSQSIAGGWLATSPIQTLPAPA